MYWLYRTRIYPKGGGLLQAKLVSPEPYESDKDDCGFGFRSPRQSEPYGKDLEFVYEIDPNADKPDDYAEDTGFDLYSKRLVDLMESFDVKFEKFPVTMVDSNGNELPELEYFVFHSLEGVLDAMDEEASEWTGNFRDGIPRLVLDLENFEHRPIFKCNNIYVQLMRDDLKQAIQDEGITGIEFLDPARFKSGKHGARPVYDD